MKRTMTLRGMQLLDHLKIATLIILAFVLISGIFIGTGFLLADHSEFQVNVTDTFRGIRQLLATLISLWALVTFFADGISDFDTALRFGHPRRHYFMVNCLIYIFFSLLTTIIDYLNQANRGLSWDTSVINFFTNFAGCFLVAIFGFAIYKWGWKVLLVLVGLNFLGGVSFGLLGLVFEDSLSRIIQILSELPTYAYQGIGVLLLLAILAIYYWTIHKIEVK